MSAQPEERFYVECCSACPLRSEPVAAAVVQLAERQHHGLTKREITIMRLLAEGLENAEIGQRLFIATVTVKTNLTSIHQKLGTRNRTEVAVWAVRNGLA